MNRRDLIRLLGGPATAWPLEKAGLPLCSGYQKEGHLWATCFYCTGSSGLWPSGNCMSRALSSTDVAE